MKDFDPVRWAKEHPSAFGFITALAILWALLGAPNRYQIKETPRETGLHLLNYQVNKQGELPEAALVILSQNNQSLLTSIQVDWKTDLPSDSELKYGNSPTDLSSRKYSSFLLLFHSQSISPATKGVAYYSKAKSCIGEDCASGPLSASLICTSGSFLNCYDWNGNGSYDQSECNSPGAYGYFSGSLTLDQACGSSTGGSCTRRNPTLTVSPTESQPTPNGTAALYNYSIRNNNTSSCPATTYAMSYTKPPPSWNWIFSWNPASISVSSGQLGTGTFTITTPSSAQNGRYETIIKTTDTTDQIFYGTATIYHNIGSGGSSPTSSSCTDSDGGKNYVVKGTTQSSAGTSIDYCSNKTTLIEYYCPTATGAHTSETRTCTGSCVDGACKTHTPIYYNQFSDSQITGNDVTFADGAINLHGYLCRPTSTSVRRPGLVYHRGGINNTSGVTRDTCAAYAKAGFVTLAFDYQGEGGSGGAKSLWTDDLSDTTAAYNYLRSLSYVDTNNFAYVGFSRGGENAFYTFRPLPSTVRAMASTAFPADVKQVYDWHQQNGTLSRIDDFMQALKQSRGCDNPYNPSPQCPNVMNELSIINNVSRINVPVYFAWGTGDGIIPRQVMQNLVTAFTSAGKDVTYREYSCLTHDYSGCTAEQKNAEWEDHYQRLFDWFAKKLN